MRRCPLKLASLWHQTWSEHRWCRVLWVRREWSWEQLSKVGGLGVGKIFLLTLCHEQEEGRLPTSLIFQLCTSLLFQFLFFSSLLSHFLGSQPLFSLLVLPSLILISHVRPPSLWFPGPPPRWPFPTLAPSPSSWGRRQSEGFPLLSAERLLPSSQSMAAFQPQWGLANIRSISY